MKNEFGAKIAFDTLPEHMRPPKAGGDNSQAHHVSTTSFVDLRTDVVKAKSAGARSQGQGLAGSLRAARPPLRPRFMPPDGPGGPRMGFPPRGPPRPPPPFCHRRGFGPPNPWPIGPRPHDPHMWRPLMYPGV